MAPALLIIGVVGIVLALVYYLVSVIFALQKITTGLDEAISAVGEIVEKSAPVKPVVDDINANLDAAVSALEGLLVKKAGMEDASGSSKASTPAPRRRVSATSPTAPPPRRRGSARSTRAAR